MSRNNNNKNKNNPPYNNAINQMSNFGVLPSTPTPTSSSTPGPPPFNILQTPFFVARDAFYSVHPETLRHMNQNANDFGL